MGARLTCSSRARGSALERGPGHAKRLTTSIVTEATDKERSHVILLREATVISG